MPELGIAHLWVGRVHIADVVLDAASKCLDDRGLASPRRAEEQVAALVWDAVLPVPLAGVSVEEILHVVHQLLLLLRLHYNTVHGACLACAAVVPVRVFRVVLEQVDLPGSSALALDDEVADKLPEHVSLVNLRIKHQIGENVGVVASVCDGLPKSLVQCCELLALPLKAEKAQPQRGGAARSAVVFRVARATLLWTSLVLPFKAE
mmetsp:Transcript_2087/g.6281  ORF Transcript_2087/g.6281 Transcript_2087/m.6281 type:complete len:206 (-) Transcript_2087:420-1037(-)